MYINFAQMMSYDLDFKDVAYLVMIRQKEALADGIPMEDIVRFTERNLIERQKNGKYKLTTRGGSLLTIIETPGMTAEIEEARDALIDLYKERGKETGMIKDIEKRLSWLMGTTGFKVGPIIEAATYHLDTRGEYVMRLDNLIWKPANVFNAHMSLSESMMFDIIAKRYGLSHDAYLKESRNKVMEWMFAVATLPSPPAKGDKEIYISGDPRTEKEGIARIRKILGNKLRENHHG